MRRTTVTRAHPFWTGRCVIITGSSSGIGRALALHLSARGAKVGLMARRHTPLEQLANEIRKRGGKSGLEVVNVDHPEAVAAAVASLEGHLGTCDVMIANAGIHRESQGHDFDIENANAVITTNVIGVINSVGAVLPGMLRRKRGHIVAIASIAAMVGLPEVGVYSASKAAVVTLMESLRVDFLRTGIKVTTICPGFIDTPLIKNHERSALAFLMSADAAAARISKAIERGRAECWFPWQTWLMARMARALPHWAYARWARRVTRRARRRSSGHTSHGTPRGADPNDDQAHAPGRD